LGSRNRYEEGIYTEEGEGVPVVERGKRRSEKVHIRTTEERIYLILKVVSNGTGILCREEGW